MAIPVRNKCKRFTHSVLAPLPRLSSLQTLSRQINGGLSITSAEPLRVSDYANRLVPELLSVRPSTCSHASPSGWEISGEVQNTFKENRMINSILLSAIRLHRDEAGQGLVEYALIIALVAFAAVVGMNTLAADINQAFSLIGSVLDVDIP